MKLDIQKAKKFIGKAHELNCSFHLPADIFLNYKVSPLGALTLSGTYMFESDEVLKVNLNAEIFLDATCYRCGKSFVYDYKFDVNEVFASNPQDDEYKLTNINVDLMQPAIDNFITKFPSQILCKEDCLGVCPKCGANLNEKKCDCANSEVEEDTSNPFYVLKHLK